MKLLILCNDFPPLNSIGAQRPYSWYEHLSESGITPVVVTKNWKGHSSTPLDVVRNAGEDDVVTEQTAIGTIIRVPFRITPTERMLLTYGEHKHRLLRKTITFLFRVGSFFSSRMDTHRNILIEADRYLKKNKVDCIIATGEPFLLFRYAWLLNKRYNIPWIADYRDGWWLNHVSRRKRDLPTRLLRRWELLFEKTYIRSAMCITTADPSLAAEAEELHRKKVEIIYNGFDGFYTGPRDEPTSTLPLILNHTGTLTPGQRVEMLLQAIKELLAEKRIGARDLDIRFIGLNYFPEQCKRIFEFDPAVAACITTTPRIARTATLRMNSGADYLLAFTDEQYKIIYAKTYDYIAVKRPVLIIPDDQSILSDLVSRLNAGLSLQSVDDVKTFLLNAINQKRNGLPVKPFPVKEQDALFYTRRHQAQRLAEVLRNIFKTT